MTKGRGLTRIGGALVWMVGLRASAQPVEGGAKPVERDAPAEEQERPDHVRPRGGLQIGGGAVFVPEHDSAGAAIQVSARLGVQINHYFGVYYQNSPTLLFAQDVQEGMRILAGFMDQNILLLSLTLGHVLEISAGPAIDFTLMTECSQALAWRKIQGALDPPGSLDLSPCEAKTGLHPGAHGKLAIHLMGWNGDCAERMGLSFLGEAHPTFIQGTAVVTATGGIGVEWF